MTGPRREGDPRGSLGPPLVELVRLPARRRAASALAVLVASLGLVGVGWWKPWSAAGFPLTASSDSPVAATADARAALGASREPSDTSGAIGGSAHGPMFLGLDLSGMGSRVQRDGWGVATASVPRDAIERANREPGGAITPIATWTTILPGSRAPGPAIAGADAATVALAVTWPRGIAPRRVRLEYLGPAGGPGATFGPRERRTIPLSLALPGLLAPVPADWRAIPGYVAPAWDRTSGTFYLSPAALAGARIDWSADGWTGGAYAFRIETADGTIVRLPFRLGG